MTRKDARFAALLLQPAAHLLHILGRLLGGFEPFRIDWKILNPLRLVFQSDVGVPHRHVHV
jgi:hypothetical protein